MNPIDKARQHLKEWRPATREEVWAKLSEKEKKFLRELNESDMGPIKFESGEVKR